MPRLSRSLAFLLRGFWRGLRQWCGDADYESYLGARWRRPDLRRGAAPLSREEFYLEQLNRRYSRLSRCC